MGGNSSKFPGGQRSVALSADESKRESRNLEGDAFQHFAKAQGRVKNASWLNEVFDEDFLGPCTKLLGLYDEYAILNALEHYGVDQVMLAKGFANLQVENDLSDSFVHKLSIYGKKSEDFSLGESNTGDEENCVCCDNINPNVDISLLRSHKKNGSSISLKTKDRFSRNLDVEEEKPEKFLLFQVFLRKIQSFDNLKQTNINKVYGSDSKIVHKVLEWRNLDLLQIEWLLLQNPLAPRNHKQQLFPGQKYPGLGIGPLVLKIFREMTGHMNRDGMVNVPMYFHNALLFSRYFMFLSPIFEGIFLTLVADLKEDLRRYGLPSVSNAILQGRLKLKPENERRVVWVAEEQVYPSSKRMVGYFNSEEYANLCNEYTFVKRADSDGEFSAEELLSKSPSMRRDSPNSLKKIKKKSNCNHLEEPVPLRLEGRLPDGAGIFEIDWDGELPSNEEMEQAIKLRNVDTRLYKD
eukprot:Nk52_evm9s236 gene=Nk52_evmTU9s236